MLAFNSLLSLSLIWWIEVVNFFFSFFFFFLGGGPKVEHEWGLQV